MWYTPLIPVLRLGRQENQKFKVILSYISSLRVALSYIRPYLKREGDDRKLSMAIHACDLSIWEAEVGRW